MCGDESSTQNARQLRESNFLKLFWPHFAMHAELFFFAPFTSFNGVFTFSATFCYGMSTTLHLWVLIAFQLLMQEFILIVTLRYD